MGNKKRAVALTVFALCCIAVIGFIWENSMQYVASSNARSTRILELLKPFLSLFVGDERVTNQLVRKLAHFAEFSALGFFSLAFWRVALKKRSVCFTLLTALIVASADELIQNFNDRAPSVADVALDFFGAVFGIALLWILLWGYRKIKEKMNHEK